MLRLPPNYSFIAAVLTAATATLALVGGWPAGGWLFGFLYLLTLGRIVGSSFFRDESRGWSLFLGTLVVGCGLTMQGAAVYRMASLSPAWCAGLIALVGVEALIGAAARRNKSDLKIFGVKRDGGPSASTGIIGIGLALTVAVASWSLLDDLAAVATEKAARSPWDIAPAHFLPVFALLALLIAGSAIGGWLRGAAPWGLAALGLVAVSVALKTYAVGFGFDPFIHRATESAIVQYGLISPKPFYYLGQYALVTLAARVTGWAVGPIDSWLVPALFAAALPLAWWSMRRTLKVSCGGASWAALSLLALPLGSFIMTTPQGVADTLAVMTAFLVLPAAVGSFPVWPSALAGLTVVSVHPITGIPVMVMVVAVTLSRRVSRLSPRWRVRLGAALAFAGAASLPALFIANSYLSGTVVSFDPTPLWKPWLIWQRLVVESPPRRLYSPLLDFAYTWLSARNAVLLLAIGLGAYPLAKRRALWPFAVGGGSAAFAYILLKAFLGFDFLISYERDNYANRLWPIALLLLSPVIASAVAFGTERLRRQTAVIKITASILLVGTTVSSVYLAYPRRDRHDPSRGWSTSRLDIEAVRLIEKDAGNDTYAVLANQSVSAAAIGEFGFAGRYVKDPYTPESELYFYPVPTSSPLYDNFLAMNQAKGHRRLADFTLNWLKVDHLYYVVSSYWYESGSIVPLARKQADAFWNLKNDIFIFKYDFK
jgi:hypothetical protein